MNKYAEIQNRYIMYQACKGLLRVKLAAAAAGAPDPTAASKPAPAAGTAPAPASGTAPAPASGTAPANATAEGAAKSANPYTNIGGDIADSIAEYALGSPEQSGWARWLGGKATELAGAGVDNLTKWMAGKEGWLGNVGKFLQNNKESIGTAINGLNDTFHLTDMLNAGVKEHNFSKAMEAQQKEQENAQFDPNAMFAGMFQNLATAGQNMYQPSQYSGSTYRPSFA